MSSFTDIIDRFASDPSDPVMEELVEMAKRPEIRDDEIAYLAERMAESGTIMSFNDKGSVADIASTGGPSSLSTLLCPLFLRSFGYIVPKLGVPDRPAGGIDVLAQIPGYRYELNDSDIATIISRSGYAHFLVSQRFAPLDAILFEFRKRRGALHVPTLVIASILAKKNALGVKLAGLDVRVAPHGNFGSTKEMAAENSSRFCKVAQLIGHKAVCFLTNNVAPYQPFIGRGESLLALSLLMNNQASPWLDYHANLCYGMARKLTASDRNTLSQARFSRSDLSVFFIENLEAQGTSYDQFMDYVTHISRNHKYELLAQEEGFLSVDLGKLRELITGFQAKALDRNIRFADPCGIILKKQTNSFVRKGELIASLRIDIQGVDLQGLFEQAFTVKPDFHSELFFKEVNNG